MKSHFEDGTMVFRKDYNGKALYSVGLSKKDVDGNRIYGYIAAKFRKGIELDDKTRIIVKNGWLDFYKKGNITVPQIMITEFEVAKPVPQNAAPSQAYFEAIDEDMPF